VILPPVFPGAFGPWAALVSASGLFNRPWDRAAVPFLRIRSNAVGTAGTGVSALSPVGRRDGRGSRAGKCKTCARFL